MGSAAVVERNCFVVGGGVGAEVRVGRGGGLHWVSRALIGSGCSRKQLSQCPTACVALRCGVAGGWAGDGVRRQR